MVTAILLAIGTILAFAGILAGALKSWLRKPEKEWITESLTVLWYKSDAADSMAFVRGPVKALRGLFDVILGPRIFSRRALFRVSLIGSMLLITTLAVVGALAGDPFGGVRPWRLLWINSIIAASLLKNNQVSTIPHQVEFCRYFANVGGIVANALISIGFCILALAINAILDFISVALVRQVLRELEDARGFLTFLMGLGFSLFLSMVTGAFAVFATVLLAFPVMWPLAAAMFRLTTVSVVIPLLGVTFVSMIAWFVGGPVIKIEAIIATLPSIIVGIALAWAVLTFRFQRHIHIAVTQLLLRMAEAGPEAIALCASLLGVITGVVGLLARL